MNTPRDDTVADAHLRAALRHAPDADIGAPAYLGAQIIAAGHRAAAQAATPPRRLLSWWPRWWERWWQTPWTLGRSGAFATLLLAGFLGLLWRGETPGPAREEAPVAAAPALSPPTRATTPSAGPPVSPPVSPSDTTAVTPSAKPPASTVTVQAPNDAPVAARAATDAATPPQAPTADAAAQGRAGPSAAVLPTVPVAAPAPSADRRREAPSPSELAHSDAMLKPSLPAPSPAPAPAAAPSPAAALAPAPASVMPAPGPAFTPPPPAAAAVANSARATQAARQAVAAQGEAAQGAMLVAPRPEAPWMPALAEGLAVQWQLDGLQRPAPSSWLYAVAAQAQGRWVPATGTPAAGERSLQWQQGNVVLGRLWLNAERVLACDAQARCQQAPLAPDIARELLKNMPR